MRITLTSPCAVTTFTRQAGRPPAWAASTDRTRPPVARWADAAAPSRPTSAQAGVASATAAPQMREAISFMVRAMLLPLDRHHGHAHRQAVAGVLTHEGLVDLAAVLVVHPVTGELRLHFIDGAALPDFARGLLVLRILRSPVAVGQMVARQRAHHRTHRRGHVLAAALADLVPQDAAGHATDDGAAVVVARGRRRYLALLADPVAGALFPRRGHVLVLGFDATNAGMIDEALCVGASRSRCKQTDDGKTFHEKGSLGCSRSPVCAG